MQTCKNIKHMFIHEQCFLNQETARYNDFVFYVSVSKAMVLCFMCQCQKQTIRCLFARVRVCLCVWFSTFCCAYACHHSLNASLKTDQWKGTLKPINMNLEVTVHLHAVTTNPKHPINTPLFLCLEGCSTTASLVLNLFYFTHSSLKIPSLFTWTLTKTKVRPLFEKLVAEMSGLNELLANDNNDKTKFLKMSAQVGEQMITDKTNYLKWVHGSVANGIWDKLLEPSGWLCLSELVADGDFCEYEAIYLKTTVCSMAPRHCTIFFVIITSTCSSKCRLGSWNTGKAWYHY